jgi:hypothetical protein
MLLTVFINNKLYHFKEEISILEACNSIGIKLPRFCYHEYLSIAGNCRMCLVEIEKSLKPVVSCSTDIISNISIFTNSTAVLKARENVLEFILLNHPLDCPICDQAGECDLQDHSIFFGSNFGRNYFLKRAVEDKYCGNIIRTVMNRCIHCTRCVRFGEEVCGLKFFGTLSRGVKTEIGNYILKLSISEVSANVIDLCPVGALTLKTVAFQVRSWELESLESIDLSDCLGSNIYLLYKNLDIYKVVAKKNILINDNWISNKARYYFNCFNKKKEKNFSNCYSIQLLSQSLILLNSDLSLNILNYIKKNSNFRGISFKLMSSTAYKKNYYFWGSNSKIYTISELVSGICFLLGVNLQNEASILNIRVRYKVISSEICVYSLGSFFKSNFPIKFMKFSLQEIIRLLVGKHFILSNFFFKYNLLFFSSRLIMDAVDINLFNYLNFKLFKNLFFNVTSFCNSPCSQILNFKKFNFKEYLFSKQIFSLNLDDNYILRKMLNYNFKMYWINSNFSDVLLNFPELILISISNSQQPGFFLNIEQRVQKFSLPLILPFTLFDVLQKLFHIFVRANLKFVFNCLKFLKPIFVYFDFMYFIEVFKNPKLYYKNKNKYFFFNFLFSLKNFFFYKLFPLKSSIEDCYRSSLYLKTSSTMYKSSQLLRLDSFL